MGQQIFEGTKGLRGWWGRGKESEGGEMRQRKRSTVGSEEELPGHPRGSQKRWSRGRLGVYVQLEKNLGKRREKRFGDHRNSRAYSRLWVWPPINDSNSGP